MGRMMQHELVVMEMMNLLLSVVWGRGGRGGGGDFGVGRLEQGAAQSTDTTITTASSTGRHQEVSRRRGAHLNDFSQLS